MKAKIAKVVVKAMFDDSPDTSWMGEFSDSPKDHAIIRQGENSGNFVEDVDPEDMPERGREYRFFNPPAENYKGEKEADIRKYCLQDWERMEALNRGDYCFLGIQAEAEILTAAGFSSKGQCWLRNKIHSGVLWGIESDSNGYKEEVAQEQLAELKTVLLGIGFSASQVRRALAKAEMKLDEF